MTHPNGTPTPDTEPRVAWRQIATAQQALCRREARLSEKERWATGMIERAQALNAEVVEAAYDLKQATEAADRREIDLIRREKAVEKGWTPRLLVLAASLAVIWLLEVGVAIWLVLR